MHREKTLKFSKILVVLFRYSIIVSSVSFLCFLASQIFNTEKILKSQIKRKYLREYKTSYLCLLTSDYIQKC